MQLRKKRWWKKKPEIQANWHVLCCACWLYVKATLFSSKPTCIVLFRLFGLYVYVSFTWAKIAPDRHDRLLYVYLKNGTRTLKSARTYVDAWFMTKQTHWFHIHLAHRTLFACTLIRAHTNTVPYSLFRRFLLSQLRTVSLTHIRQHAHIFTCMQKNSCISISKMVCLSMGSSILPDYYCKWNDCTLKPQNNVAAQKRATKQTKWAQSAINDVYLWITYARAFLVVAFFLDLLPFEWSDLMVLRRNKLYAFCFHWLKF